ncbi:MAG: CoB--CoM heterodisulfide reductase iron-sulfur subunit B family protein [Deltaproteobacteria bacterium]|nr:CoB--CoM heterodisulfide reductase iron-sulfur subunit B family protein [Deltaproteobacteria bacterium]
MRYFYYPGCSLEGTAREYDLSTRAFLGAVGVELVDLPDWTCCGATAAQGMSRLLALALPARNLALAEKTGGNLDILVPCSACYLNLRRAEDRIRSGGEAKREINEALSETGLHCDGRVRVRHLLDVLSRDLDAASLADRVTRPLHGMRIAPYYGCQCLRPYADFDDPEEPRTMEPLIRSTGAEIFPWTVGAHCCGASHMTTKPEIGIELVAGLLDAARGADAVVTVCPMCQMNLEAYQRKASSLRGSDLSATILYLPQLLGLALGLSRDEVRLDLNLAVGQAFRKTAA